MANIRNSISMTDRMTPTLRSILKSMDSMMKVMQNLDKASNNGKQSKAYKQVEKDIKRANNALIKMDNYTQRTGHSASQAATQYGHLGKAVSSVANGMRSVGNSSQFFLQSLASGVYLAQKLANQVSGIMTSADTSRSQVARLGLYNTSQYTNEQLYGQIMRTALDTRSGLTETADLVNKILISGVYEGQGAPLAAIGTAAIINKALVAGGGTAEENQRALRQLTQGLASGVLQGDELRSIREQTPYFMQVLAEGLSKIDERFEGIGIGDLKELGAQGELTADRIVKAMWAMQDEVDADFKQMPRTFGQAVTSMKNIWQYFLYLLSDAEGPLGRINNLMWKLVDYLQTPQGFELMNSIATGFDIIVTVISGVMTQIGKFITFLQENANVAKAIFFALAASAVIAAVPVIVAWVAVSWPILLIIALVGVLVHAFLEAGFTMTEIVRSVAGFIMAAIAVICDILLSLISFILLLLEAAAYVGWTIIMLLYLIGMVFSTVAHVAVASFEYALSAILSKFYSFYSVVSSIILSIAKLIDSVFDTGLYDAAASFDSKISGWFEGKIETLRDKSDYNMQELSDLWSQFADIGAGGYGKIFDTGRNAQSFFGEYWLNPGELYNSGYDWGNGLMEGLGDFNLGFPTDSVFGTTGIPDNVSINGMPDSVGINGGDLDSVGSIKSDVSVSDEDIQLLRDMAARDYLLQVQSVTPVANVTFGDVRETADVNKLVEVIENMVEEQMATALVS